MGKERSRKENRQQQQQQQQQSLIPLGEVGYMNHTAKDQLADVFTKSLWEPSIMYISDKLNAYDIMI